MGTKSGFHAVVQSQLGDTQYIDVFPNTEAGRKRCRDHYLTSVIDYLMDDPDIDRKQAEQTAQDTINVAGSAFTCGEWRIELQETGVVFHEPRRRKRKKNRARKPPKGD